MPATMHTDEEFSDRVSSGAVDFDAALVGRLRAAAESDCRLRQRTPMPSRI